jgi:hypothetical protein
MCFSFSFVFYKAIIKENPPLPYIFLLPLIVVVFPPLYRHLRDALGPINVSL